ncbi:MAG: hypothetical protein M3Y59_16520, partial [Myxococcota bacterium]|nr:hypothetical protein [Myxococcota bacterium]
MAVFDGENGAGFAGPGTLRELVGDIRWEPYGGVRKYRLATTTGTDPTVEYLREGISEDPVSSCQSAVPSSTDVSGRLRAVWVSRSGNGDIYRRAYRWRADQVAEEHTCFKSGPAEIVSYQYDNQLRLTSATRPTVIGSRMIDVGGSVGRRTYSFGTSNDRGNRAHDEHDCWGFDLHYDGPDRLDRLQQRVPVTGGCLSQACSGPLPIAGQGYNHDAEGKVTKRWTPASYADSYEELDAGQKLVFDWTPTTVGSDAGYSNAAIEGVYRTVTVHQGKAATRLYEHFYDAFGRRRFKRGPIEDREFFYDGVRLLEDKGGNVGSQTPIWGIDEYVWLDGKPVAMLRGGINEDGFHDYEVSDGTCQDAYQCGVYFIVTDHIGKPVVMLDANDGKVTGTGDYDPFGHVNRATLLADTAHPHGSNTNQLLASIKQPVRSGITQQVRARYAMVDTASGASATLTNKEDTANLSCPSGGYSSAGGTNQGSVATCWVNVPADGIIHVRFKSGTAANTARQGVAMEGYEFRRAETGAPFVWTSLRLPGQYHDPETDLFENW